MRVAPTELIQARVASINAALAARNLDALLVTHLSNIAYLTGFFASAAAVIVNADGVTLIGDGRYAESIAERARDCTFIHTRLVQQGMSYDETVVGALLPLGRDARVACEASHLTLSRYNFVAKSLADAGWVTPLAGVDGIVEAGRVRKDEWEIGVLREGAGRLSEVAKCILPKRLAGRTELEVAAEIDHELRRAGFARPAFDTIVAAGPNAARPHARATERRIESGEVVVLDFGGVLDGYCTDLTRTITAGPAGARERRVIDQVMEAQAAAFAAITPGGAPEAVDAAARRTLEGHGIGAAFSHGTGHGLGLEVHEAPRLSPARPSHTEPPLAAGMVMTLEPGAYFPGWGGVRIEDDVLVTATGAEWLTDVPKLW
jgi:Xaa-Pro aminopeptidase